MGPFGDILEFNKLKKNLGAEKVTAWQLLGSKSFA